METIITKPSRSILENWKTPLIFGFLFILSGILMLLVAHKNPVSLSVYLGILILVSGAVEIVSALFTKKLIKGWVWVLLGGIVDFLMGVLFIGDLVMSTGVLSLYVVFWLLFRSIMAIGISFEQQSPDLLPWQWLLIFVISTFIFVYSIVTDTFLGGLQIYSMMGVSTLILGFVRIIMAIGLKQIFDTVSIE